MNGERHERLLVHAKCTDPFRVNCDWSGEVTIYTDGNDVTCSPCLVCGGYSFPGADFRCEYLGDFGMNSERGKWLRTTGVDGRQHVLWLPERANHALSVTCACEPRVDEYGVVVHTVLVSISSQRSKQTGVGREH